MQQPRHVPCPVLPGTGDPPRLLPVIRRPLTLFCAFALAATLATPAVADPPGSRQPPGKSPKNPHSPCARMDSLAVPGAEMQKTACLDDLTTTGTVASGHTVPADYNGLHDPRTVNPSGVAGIQIDGYFPDTSTSNTNNGWNHDSQFVIRLPDKWNGGIVITGAPGSRTQYANDFIISDTVLAKGYAFASTDKGNNGPEFYQDGDEPGDAVAEWHTRVTELTEATRQVAQQRYRQQPQKTLLFGISNGGYLVRWQLENRPDLYDGGVDWEGTLFTPGAGLVSYLPATLRHYPAWAGGDLTAHAPMIEAGLEPGTEYLWPFHHRYYWDFTQRTFREQFDPAWDGDLDAGIPFCTSGTPHCDADYDISTRPEAQEALRKVSLTGDIGKPLITLHGTHDALLPIRIQSDVYDTMIEDAGKSHLHRYYRYEGGTHVDSLYPLFPDRVRPLLPCARTSFDALEKWTGADRPGRKRGTPPPPDATLARPGSGDLLTTCSLR